ncbi:MAG: hypothetical protein R6V19_06650, partial [Armatimonadota bacterium]
MINISGKSVNSQNFNVAEPAALGLLGLAVAAFVLGASDLGLPEPDLPPLVLSRSWVEDVDARMPELPEARIERYTSTCGLSRQDAMTLVD